MKTADVVVRTISFFFIAALAVTSASAASLIGKVTEVHEGDLVTIMSLNKPVKIRVMAIDAPDKDQPYYEIARQHLSHLVMEKLVVVEYAGLVQSRYILGKMFVGDQDIGAQMLRDGVAWYDANNATRLTPDQQHTYDAIEKLARSERRGLWQETAPTSPWAFRESSELQAKLASMNGAELKKGQPKPPSSLSDDDLVLGGSSGKLRTAAGDSLGWKTITPPGYSFSVRVPADSNERGVTLPIHDGKQIDYHVSVGHDGNKSYMVAWGQGPKGPISAATVLDDIASRFTTKLNGEIRKDGQKAAFDIVRERDLKLGAVHGAEYKLGTGDYKGILRVFTREFKTERQIFFIAALNVKEPDANVYEFLRSLDFSQPKVDQAVDQPKVDQPKVNQPKVNQPKVESAARKKEEIQTLP